MSVWFFKGLVFTDVWYFPCLEFVGLVFTEFGLYRVWFLQTDPHDAKNRVNFAFALAQKRKKQ